MKITRNQILAIKAKLETQGKRLSPNSTIFREYKSTLNPLTSYQKEAAIGHLRLFFYKKKKRCSN